ncbi:MAG: L,D-transpeptidase family protein, partial [Gammaproteobacteria bacterium]|nr:L,D-transpeptidase family protein [Gammaproteobacteria bacterium]
DLARIHRLGYEEIRLANPDVDTWLPGDGTEVMLPTQYILPNTVRTGLVVNLSEYRMYYYYQDDGRKYVLTFPISIGRMDWGTPLGLASVVAKVKNPDWYPPQSIREEHLADGRGELARRVPAGPDNPLGDYAMRLSIPGYLIHGTNRPAGVGMRVTHGCIRMFPEDIEWLFPKIPVKTQVRLINQPYKLGWSGNDLYLEVHPPLEEGSTAEEDASGEIVAEDDGVPVEEATVAEDPDAWSMTRITELYIKVTEDRPAIVDWELVEQVYEERLGVPVKVGRAKGQLPDDYESAITVSNAL